MPVHLLAVLLFYPALWNHNGGREGHSHVGAWTLQLHEDKFAGGLRCRLSRHSLDYTRQALVVHLSPHSDTSNAVYRVDGGPPISVKSDAMELARLGFALDDDDLSNPSGGLIRIPEERVLAAQSVTVEVKPFASLTNVKVDGFAAALAIARKAGCTPEDFN